MDGVALFADELHHLGIRHQAMIHAHRERLGIGFGIVDGESIWISPKYGRRQRSVIFPALVIGVVGPEVG